jgi:WD40 repeat protein
VLHHGHAVVDFALTRGGREALVAFEDRSIRLWDLEASVAGAGASHLHHTKELVAAAIDVEGERIVTASAQEALLWRRGEAGLELMRSLGGHESPIRGAAVAGDGTFGATVDEDGKVLLWPLGDADDVAPRSYVSVRRPRQLAFAGRHLVVAGDRGACVISPGDADERRCRELTVAGELGSLAVAPGVPKIALAGYDRTVTLLDLDAHARGGVANTLIKTGAAMAIVAMSADGQRIAAASESGALGVARAGEGALRELQSAGGIVALAFSPRGEWLAAADERAVHLYRPDAHGTPIRSLSVDATVTVLAFAGDGLLLATTDGRLRRWPLSETGDALLIGEQRGVLRWLRVAADGEFALAAGDSNTAHLWPLSPTRLLEQARRVLGPREPVSLPL